jgi:hypothetical protein
LNRQARKLSTLFWIDLDQRGKYEEWRRPAMVPVFDIETHYF